MINDPFDFEDKRTEEPIEDNRQRDFVRGWNKAISGGEYGDALNKLSWRTLGWRLGMIFGETDRTMVNMMYFWCVQQQST